MRGIHQSPRRRHGVTASRRAGPVLGELDEVTGLEKLRESGVRFVTNPCAIEPPQHLVRRHFKCVHRVSALDVTADDVRHLDVVLLDPALSKQGRRLEPFERFIRDFVGGAWGSLRGRRGLLGGVSTYTAGHPISTRGGDEEGEEPGPQKEHIERDRQWSLHVPDIRSLVEADAHNLDDEGIRR